jgi:threonine dehydrogenase-like Zn-dependent dehydrogenase
MQQVIQNIRNGKLGVVELPEPMARPGQVLIANAASVISAGTEKMILALARKSLLGKARERPDHVRRVLEKLRNEGVFQTLQQVRTKLDEPMALGYSSAGVVLACGAGVQEFKPGDLVASNGPHAGVVSVPRQLCARVPEGVRLEHAAFTTIGAIALQGVRLARVGLGETVFVVGLGLVGQITVALAAACGCRVLGTDPDAAKCELARRSGADDARPDLGARAVAERTRGLGADAVIVAAATASNQPIELAAEAVRQKGRVVAVGAVGLDLPRRPFYFKEAEFVVSCSYGPGRYDPSYEERGQDYPAAHVRWTEQRNFEAVLGLVAARRLDLEPLISHRFAIDEAERAYDLIDRGSEPYLGILLRFPDADRPARRTVRLAAASPAGRVGVGCLGAGNFARAVLLPLVAREPRLAARLLCAPGALGALQAGERHGFAAVTTDEAELFSEPEVGAVFVVTRHDQHARQVSEALRAGKHVFVEKPLALSVEEVAAVEQALAAREPAPLLMVGFNRRFSPAACQVREFFAGTGVPLTIAVRFNAGEIPAEHWTRTMPWAAAGSSAKLATGSISRPTSPALRPCASTPSRRAGRRGASPTTRCSSRCDTRTERCRAWPTCRAGTAPFPRSASRSSAAAAWP